MMQSGEASSRRRLLRAQPSVPATELDEESPSVAPTKLDEEHAVGSGVPVLTDPFEADDFGGYMNGSYSGYRDRSRSRSPGHVPVLPLVAAVEPERIRSYARPPSLSGRSQCVPDIMLQRIESTPGLVMQVPRAEPERIGSYQG